MVIETLPSIKTDELDVKAPIDVLRRVFPVREPQDYIISETADRIIGREPPVGGLKLEDVEASRSHARIFKRGSSICLEDLNSTNGTFVNNTRVSRCDLYSNDLIQIGRSLFVYCRLELGLSSFGALEGKLESLSRLETEEVAKRAAKSTLSILITGETGAGKEKLAEAIHQWSDRAGPFVAVNCAAIPSELIASELFGHLKGAFSGASDKRDGLFQRAQGGTLFLDEIAELPMSVQATLLRACETGLIRPVGSDVAKAVDVRLVSATHTDLDEAVDAGRFRADLLARLRGVTCKIPPLRQRRDELLGLFDTFVDHREFGLTVAKALLNYEWRENVRGLKKVAAHALLFSDDDTSILPQHLPEHLRFSNSVEHNSQDTESEPEDLVSLLKACRGNVAEVARRAGVHRQQVYRWITRAQLNPKDYRR